MTQSTVIDFHFSLHKGCAHKILLADDCSAVISLKDSYTDGPIYAQMNTDWILHTPAYNLRTLHRYFNS